jgi:hypothetical protein
MSTGDKTTGGGGSLAKLFSAEFPANREKYREFREFSIEIATRDRVPA